jgi:hypothetical protein
MLPKHSENIHTLDAATDRWELSPIEQSSEELAVPPEPIFR